MKKIVTHTTPRFHTDDVFAVAVFDLLYNGDIEVIRTHDQEIIDSADIVVDEGREYDPERNRFDHHQQGGAGKRDNGVEYASIGLVWKHYGEELCGSKEVADAVDKVLIQPIDASDNGQDFFELKGDVRPYLLQDVTNLYRNYDDDEEAALKHFLEAVELAKFILEKEIAHAKNYVAAKKQAHEVYKNSEDKRVIIFEDEDYSSGTRIDTLFEFEEPLYIIYPDKGRSNSWRIKCMKDKKFGFGVRKPLPQAWSGLFEEELQKVSGVEDAMFCHRALFTCAARTKEGAIKMAEKALEN